MVVTCFGSSLTASEQNWDSSYWQDGTASVKFESATCWYCFHLVASFCVIHVAQPPKKKKQLQTVRQANRETQEQNATNHWPQALALSAFRIGNAEECPDTPLPRPTRSEKRWLAGREVEPLSFPISMQSLLFDGWTPGQKKYWCLTRLADW